MKPTPQKLREARAKAYKEAAGLLATAAKENRDLSPEEAQRFDSLSTRIENLDARLAKLEALAEEEIETASEEEDDDKETASEEEDDDKETASEEEDDEEDNRKARRTAPRRSLPPRTPPTLRSGKPKRDHEPWKNPAHPYRLTRAIDAFLDGRLRGVEAETNQELSRRMGKTPQGFYMPTDLHSPVHRAQLAAAMERRAFDAATYGTGAIATILGTDFIDLFRKKAVVQKAGARILTQMEGNFALPKQTGTTTAAWVAEGTAPSGSQQTIAQVTFAPKTVAAWTDITRRLIKQSSMDAEAFVRDDISKVIALAVDLASINGAGTTTEPQGLLQNPNVPTVTLGTNGAALTWAKLIEFETVVANNNADEGNLAYIINSATRGKLKTTVKDANTAARYLMEGTLINDTETFVSNQMPSNLVKGSSGAVCSAVLYGNFDDLVIATWGAVDILVDPYTGSNSGTVRVNALQDVDIKPRRAESFTKAVDVLTT